MTQNPVKKPLVIANHMGPEFGAFLASLPSSPKVIELTDKEHPWTIPAEAEVLITRALTGWRKAPATGPELPALKWVQTFSAGTEIYPGWLKAGRSFTCGHGLTSPQIAEYVLAAMLRFEKRLDEIRTTSPAEWQECEMGSLEGKCLGIIGFGAIGQEIAHRARAFGMEIRVSRHSAWKDIPEGIVPAASPAELFEKADHLVLAAPLTDATRGMVNEALLAKAKPGMHLVNIARGAMIVEDALIAALDSGRLAFATLDVTSPEPLPGDNPLWTHPKVLLTPHISYLGGTEIARFKKKVANNLDAYLTGRPLTDLVDPVRGY